MDWDRAILIVLDGVGIGEAPDAHKYGDEGSNTLVNTARSVGGLHLPHLAGLGLGLLADIPGVPKVAEAQGAYGTMQERSRGKDTTSGHWEIAGIILDRAFPTYPNGFPPDVIQAFEKAIGRKVLGNKPASGTVIIEELGKEHMETGWPIVYTSADSVFQIAAHEEVIPLDELYRMCQQAREILQGEHAVGRVITRPFVGEPGSFQRTAGRKDFSLPPPRPTILDRLTHQGIAVHAVGKIYDIFAGSGITTWTATKDNMDTVDKTIQAMEEIAAPALIFANCVDFDAVYGHRNNAQGFAQALEAFDARLPEILATLRPKDLLLIVADHGNDPTTPSTDHSREIVPLLVAGHGVRPVHLGQRESFADVAATLAALFGVEPPEAGRSFLGELAGGARSCEPST